MNQLFIIPYEGDMQVASSLLTQIEKTDKLSGICYLSLNKTYSYVKRSLPARLLKQENFFVVDGATVLADPSTKLRDTKNCIFIKNPNLVEGIETVTKTLDFGLCKHFVIDSVSTLSVYHTTQEVAKVIIDFTNNTVLNHGHVYFLITKQCVPAIMENLQQEKIAVLQKNDKTYRLTFEVEAFLELLSKIDQAIVRKKKDQAQFLYTEAMQFYQALHVSSANAQIKKIIYQRCTKYAQLIKSMK